VFLLTDTRESRWLPTLLAAATGRIAITAALGFDSYLVMRHGGAPPKNQPAAAQGCTSAHDHPPQSKDGSSSSSSRGQQQEPQRLGCYFCNDVVAPLNSTRDRAMDQQCTVARPGLAPIAGALAAELLAALRAHPAGVAAPAPAPPCSSTGAATASVPGALGAVPHMLRGCLFGFSQAALMGEAYSQCTACSPAVLEEYAAHGWEFVRQALMRPAALEELTGLAALHAQAAALALGDGDEGEDGGDDADGEGGDEEDWLEL
jgi:ubiquitin-like modifier-activating enzyme ATG7